MIVLDPLVEGGIRGLDAKVNVWILGKREAFAPERGVYVDGDFAVFNTGVRHDFEGAPFVIRAFSWADCVSEGTDGFSDKGREECWLESKCDACAPNFEHFGSGFRVWWYMHIGRGAVQNQDLSYREWTLILWDCESWVRQKVRR